MSSMHENSSRRKTVVGVDTHKHVHVAVVLDGLGAKLDARGFPADAAGYRQLAAWAESFGEGPVFGVEGTGSYGAGLASALRLRGLEVMEVGRPDRRVRRLRGKSDETDVEAAARAVLAGTAAGTAKSADGAVEMVRTVKAAKDGAVKARTAAMVGLKQVLVNAPAELREQLQPLTKMALMRRCAALRPGPLSDPASAVKHSLKAIARRWLVLDEEAKEHEKTLAEITARHAPGMVAAHGFGPDTVAELLVVVGDNPERIRSEAALAKLCGACPIPASSGKTTRHRLNRGGCRKANAALHRVVITRLRGHRPTQAYMAKRLAEGKTKREIVRCLKRHLIREIWQHIKPLRDHPGALHAIA